MEKYEKLLELIKYKNTRVKAGYLLSTHSDEEILVLAKDLNVLSIMVTDDRFTIHLLYLKDLLEIDNNPMSYTHPNSVNGETYIHYKTEVKGITFLCCKRKNNEEHKKTQAI